MFYIKSKGTERTRSENEGRLCASLLYLSMARPLPKVLVRGGGAFIGSVCFVGGNPDRRQKGAAAEYARNRG